MNELCRYLPQWIQVRDQTIPSREGISKQFWRFLRPLIIASFASSTAVVQMSRCDVDRLVSELLHSHSYSSFFTIQTMWTDCRRCCTRWSSRVEWHLTFRPKHGRGRAKGT
jgi:hypothetical protein